MGAEPDDVHLVRPGACGERHDARAPEASEHLPLAILLGAWFWLVPLAVDVANGMSGYVLSDEAVGSALRRTFAGS